MKSHIICENENKYRLSDYIKRNIKEEKELTIGDLDYTL